MGRPKKRGKPPQPVPTPKASHTTPLTQVSQRRIVAMRAVRQTTLFERSCKNLLSEGDIQELIDELLVRPDAGGRIPGTKGPLRKLRRPAKDMGKRGGARIIYIWHEGQGIIYLLKAFGKNEQEDLTSDERKRLDKFAVRMTR